MRTNVLRVAAIYLLVSSTAIAGDAKVRLAQCGFYTNCWVPLPSNVVLVMPSPNTQQSCNSAAMKCLHGRQGPIHFSTNAVLQPCNATVEKCDIPF